MRTGIHFLFGEKDAVTDFGKVIDRFADVGADCVELPPEPFLDAAGTKELQELKARAREQGVEIVFSCGFPPDCDMASDQEKLRAQGAEHLRRILDVMDLAGIRLLGGTCYTRWPAYRTDVLTMQQKEDVRKRTAEVLREAASGIETTDMEIALEPLNRFEGYLLNTAEEGAQFCRMTENPNIGLMLDGFHMSVEENSIAGAIRAAGPYLKHLHLAENNRRLPGTGEFPWEVYFRTLGEIGYRGRMDIESFQTPGGSVSASVALWRDLEQGAGRARQDEMLREAFSFIRGKCREYQLD